MPAQGKRYYLFDPISPCILDPDSRIHLYGFFTKRPHARPRDNKIYPGYVTQAAAAVCNFYDAMQHAEYLDVGHITSVISHLCNKWAFKVNAKLKP